MKWTIARAVLYSMVAIGYVVVIRKLWLAPETLDGFAKFYITFFSLPGAVLAMSSCSWFVFIMEDSHGEKKKKR